MTVSIARPRLSPLAARVLVIAGLVLGFWLLTLVFGNSTARAETASHQPDLSVVKTVDRTADAVVTKIHHTAPAISSRAQTSVSLTSEQAHHVVRRVEQVARTATTSVRRTTTQVPPRAERVVRHAVKRTEMIVSVPALDRSTTAASTGVTPLVLPLLTHVDAGSAPQNSAALGSGESLTRAAADDRQDGPSLPLTPASPPAGGGQAPSANPAGTHDVPAAVGIRLAGHRDHVVIAPAGHVRLRSGAIAPQPGFSPD